MGAVQRTTYLGDPLRLRPEAIDNPVKIAEQEYVSQKTPWKAFPLCGKFLMIHPSRALMTHSGQGRLMHTTASRIWGCGPRFRIQEEYGTWDMDKEQGKDDNTDRSV